MASKWEISAFGWNKIKGVYCICSIVDGINFIHYIGSSIDIGKRLSSSKHPYRVLYNSGHNVYVKFKETDKYIELEKKLISRLNPPINKHYNG